MVGGGGGSGRIANWSADLAAVQSAAQVLARAHVLLRSEEAACAAPLALSAVARLPQHQKGRPLLPARLPLALLTLAAECLRQGGSTRVSTESAVQRLNRYAGAWVKSSGG